MPRFSKRTCCSNSNRFWTASSRCRRSSITNYVKLIDGPNVKKGKNKLDLAEQLRADIRNFKKENDCDRLVMIWCASTESFQKASEVHASVAAFEKGLEASDANIAPSQIYAYAALQESVPFANGAPNLTVDLPVMQELSRKHNAPIAGKDFKTGQTLMKTILAPGFKARMLGAERLVLHQHPGQPRRRSAGRSGLVQDQGRVQAQRAR